jgi:thioredoxin reductase (NADPH)
LIFHNRPMPDQPDTILNRDLRNQLAVLFQQLPNNIPLFLFTQPGNNDVFNQAARGLMKAFREISDKIDFKEYDLSHDLASKWDVVRSPTILFHPERYPIRWLGAPLGEEGRTFLEALLLIGAGNSNLSEQSLGILNRIDSKRDIKLFVSATCPYCPQQAVNALKTVIEKPELITLEIIDIQCNPDLADRYSAQGVPQAYVNEVLVAQGTQPEELFVLSLEKMEQQSVFIPESDAELIENDLVIVGGGPAGLTAGIYAVRSGLNAAIVEKGPLGGQVATTPIVENYPGFTSVGGKTLVDFMVSHALEYVQIFQGEEAVDIEPGERVKVLTSRRQFLTRAVLLATGASYRHLGIPGETRLSGRGVSYCSTCDGPLFKDKNVLVVGGGNSAVTEVLHLHHIGVNVTLVHRRDSLRAQEHLTKNIFDNNIPVLWETEVKEIVGEERVQEVLLYNNKSKETLTFPAHGVFIAIGYEPAVGLAKKIGVELTPDGYIKHDSHHRTNIPAIYSAGDVEGGYKQIVTATGQGTEAAMTIYEDLMNPYWKKEKNG